MALILFWISSYARSLSRIYHEVYHGFITKFITHHRAVLIPRSLGPGSLGPTLAWPTLVWPTFRSVHASLGPRFARVMRCTHGQHMHVGCTPRLVNWASPHISMHRRHLRADNYCTCKRHLRADTMQAPLAGERSYPARSGRAPRWGWC